MHALCVVKLLGCRVGLVGGAGHEGTVQRGAQRAAVSELHDRQVAGHLQCQLEAFFAVGLCRCLRRLPHVVGHAGHLVSGGIVAEGIGGIQRVFAEFLALCGLLFLNFGKALALSAHQVRAT